MFSVTHTKPRQAYKRLLRLQKDGEVLSGKKSIHPLETAKWAERVFNYLERISAEPHTYKRVIWRNFPILGEEESGKEDRSTKDEFDAQHAIIKEYQITLSGAIEQFEAQYESEI